MYYPLGETSNYTSKRITQHKINNATAFKAALPVEYIKLDSKMTINAKDLASAAKRIYDEAIINHPFQGENKTLADELFARITAIIDSYNNSGTKELFISTNGKTHDSMYQLSYNPENKAIEAHFFTKDEDDVCLRFENGKIKHLQYSQSANPQQHLHPPIYRYNVMFSNVNGNTYIGNKYCTRPTLLVKDYQDQNIRFFHL